MKILTLIPIIFVLQINSAYAYFDPGAFTLFFQLLIAGLVGFLAYFKFQFERIKNLFKRIFKKNNKSK
tara:strand:+ start:639 stop:842 length:204 start_codon:yes stop_codon:yes gene_type:complete